MNNVISCVWNECECADPAVWQLNVPDRFDSYSAGVTLLQMCLPSLRNDNNLIAFRRTLEVRLVPSPPPPHSLLRLNSTLFYSAPPISDQYQHRAYTAVKAAL